MYLYHWLVLILLMIYIGPPALNPLWQTLYWVGTLLGACISYYLIERPTLRLRIRYGSHAPLTGNAAQYRQRVVEASREPMQS